MNDRDVLTTKATTRINNHVYEGVMKHLQYGQLSSLMRKFFNSILQLMEEGKLMDIINYIYGVSDLTLPKIKEEKTDDIDG